MQKLNVSRRSFLKKTAVATIGATTYANAEINFPPQSGKHRFVFAIDTRKCIGCDACVAACKAERNTPLGVFNTWVEKHESGVANTATKETDVKLLHLPKLCNHCESPACVKVCPVHATYRDEKDGLVLQRDDRCIGCRLCEQSCPYGVRYIDPMSNVMNKCTWCEHRTRNGLKPACVDVCPTDARTFGDLADQNDPIAEFLDKNALGVLKQEEGTRPRVMYAGLDTIHGDYIGEGSEGHGFGIRKDSTTGELHSFDVRMQNNNLRENL